MRCSVPSLFVLAAAAFFIRSPDVFAQGSAGGTVGKQGKSVSGGEEQQPAKRAKPQPAPRNVATPAAAPVGRCDRIAGAWTWKWLSNSASVVLRADGTGTATTGNTSTWTCADGLVTVAWSNGGTDRLMLSQDGARLSGNGMLGIAVTGTRN